MSEREFHKDLGMLLTQLSIYSYEGCDPFAKGLCADALASIPQWIPVSERLPEDGKTVIAYFQRFGDVGEAVYDKDLNGFSDGRGGCYGASHWMPLPEPPEVK